MSIKDLFSNKPTTMKTADSASVDIESPDFLEALRKQRAEVEPPIDFASASNFVRFGSAKEYYAESIKRVYNTYPYDGSEKEKIEYDLSSSYLDRHIYNTKYPKRVGYADFSADSHIQINRGYNETTTASSTKLSDLFKGNDAYYDSDNRKKQSFVFDLDDGVTFEWWMNKKAFGTGQETLFELFSSNVKMDLVLTGTATPVKFYGSSSAEIALTSIADTTFTNTVLADSSWKHYAVSIQNTNTNTIVDFYRDGVHKKTNSLAKIGTPTGNITGFLGSGSYGLLSASVDEFRYWNKKQSSEAIYNNYKSGVGGGANTDDYRKELSLYFKFNEGKTAVVATDRVVLDYSGRLSNGYWHNYDSSISRQSGSYTSSEVADPIVRSNHPSVQALLTEMETSGSQYDANSHMMLYDLVPEWMRNEDEGSGEELKHIVQIIASYFDTLYAQIEFLPNIKTKKYYQDDEKPLPFARRLLEERGLIVPDILINRSIIEYFGQKDLNGIQYEKDLEELKNRIYHNIYNNLEYIYKSKGTEKAYRNMLRCFGIDDEIVKLNLYTDNGSQYLTDKVKHTSQKTKHIDFDDTDNFSATIYQENFISGSGTELLEKNNAITLEAEVMVPKKPDYQDSFYYNTSFVSSSVFGLDAYQGSPSSYKYSSIEDNFQAYLVRDTVDSSRAKWVLNQIDHTSVTVQSSSALVIPSGSVFSSSANIGITGTDGFSFAFWFKPKYEETDNEQEFLKFVFADGKELKFDLASGEKIRFKVGGGNNRLWTSVHQPYNKLNFIAATTDKNTTNATGSGDWTLYHYDSNTQRATTNKGSTLAAGHPDLSTISNIIIGTTDLSEDHFSGSFDEITIWNKELTSIDIQNLHDLQGGYDSTKTILADSSSNLVRHWRFAGNLNEADSGTAFSVATVGAGAHYFERQDSFPYEYNVTTKTSTKTEVLSSPFYEEIYNNQRWNVAVKAYPVGYPFAGSFLTSSSPDYTLEFYGVSHNFDEVLHEFKVTASLPYATGSALLSTAKKVYTGARRINWSGSVECQSDVKVAAVSLYYDKLDDQSIKQHNLDPSNYGHNRIFGNPTPFLNTATNTHLPAQHTLALHWDFQTVTGSDGSGEFTVEDFSSASVNGRYGWLGNIVTQEHKGKGFGFPASNTALVKNEFIFASKKELPEMSFTSDNITVVGQADEYLYEDEDISDNVFAFEKSMYQVVSQEILNMFSTMIEYSNLFAKPVDRYRYNYKRLAHAKKLFFEKTSTDLDLDRFTSYYKWIDASISHFLQQLHPASAKFNKGIVETVESHILERPKYQHLLANIEEHKTIKDQPIRGINELTYDWAHGHSPDYKLENYNQKAIKFPDGVYLQHSNAANLTGSSGEVSISFYLRSTDTTTRNIISFGDNLKIDVEIHGGHPKIHVTLIKDSDGSEQTHAAESIIESSTPGRHWVVTYDGTSGAQAVKVYRDSNNFTATSMSGPYRQLNGSFQIGHGSTADTFDEISIWNKVLSHDDVTGIYNSKIAQDLLSHQSASNLVSFYRLGDHPDDPPDRPYKGLKLKDSKGTYDLSVVGGTLGDYVARLAGTTKVPTDDNIHCFWKKERKERGGLNSSDREQLRKVITSKTYVEKIPSFGDNSGNVYEGSTYGLRKFSMPYSFNAAEQRVIHGGINYATPKDRDLLKPLLGVHGPTEGGLPVNVVVVGIGEGQGLVDPDPCLDVLKSPTAKTKYNTTAIVGVFSNFTGDAPMSSSGVVTPTAEYLYNIKGERLFPFNMISGSEPTGYNEAIDLNYKKNAILTNLHSDTTTITNEIPMQGPFTEAWVGGRQSRHIELNDGTDGMYTRPEEWLIEIGEHPDEPIVDGAIGLVGPDYGGPYPESRRQWAIHYRDGRAKRPVNIQNISGSRTKLGNYSKNYEVVQTTGRLENNKAIKDLSDTGTFIARDVGLPATTHETSLLGVVPGANGNVFAQSSNRLTTEIKAFPTNSTGISSSHTVIATRFSAPGGFEVGSEAFLDAHAKEYSVYNSLNFRNLSVLNDSGEHIPERSSFALKAATSANAVSGDSSYSYTGTTVAFSFWFNNTIGSSAVMGQIQLLNGLDDEAAVYLRDDMQFYFYDQSGNDKTFTYNTNTATDSNTWVHYLLIFKNVSSIPKLYKNSVEISAVGTWNSTNPVAAYDEMEIRLQNQAAVQDVSIWNSGDWTQDDVDTLYNSGQRADYDNHPKKANLVDLFRFGEEFADDSYSFGDLLLSKGTAPYTVLSQTTSGNSLAITATFDEDFSFIQGYYKPRFSINMRVNSHASRREGLNTLHQRHCGRYGLDSTHGTVSSTDYVAEASFHKIHRNTLTTPRSSSSDVEITQTNNNFYVQSTLPQSDYNYSWVDSSLGDNYNVRSGTQKVFGYWPKNGMHSSSVGYDSAITFPINSDIEGS